MHEKGGDTVLTMAVGLQVASQDCSDNLMLKGTSDQSLLRALQGWALYIAGTIQGISTGAGKEVYVRKRVLADAK